MQKLAELCIRRPVFASMLILALVVVGAAAYFELGVDRFPAVDLPTVTVRAALPGATPAEIEREVTKRIEEAVGRVEGIDQLRSISGPGNAFIVATFNLDRDINVAAQDVRDRVAGIQRDLGRLGVDPPTITKANNDDSPIITLALYGKRSPRELTELADKTLKPQLERAEGVAEVRIVGGANRTMNIWLDADDLASYNLPVTAVRDALARQNVNVPGGNITGGDQEITLRTVGALQSAADFNNLIITRVNGTPVRIKDIGHADDGSAEQRSFARLNGQPCVTIDIRRQSGANTIAVINAVKDALAAAQTQLPADVHTEIIRDQSRYIDAALHEINVHLVLGSILACLVVLLFMRNWRSTLIAGIAIPTSVIATFGMMYLLDFTLNAVTMLALVLMVGVVIDDAIVVLENIYRFVEEKGMNAFDAAREGTREIALAVLATTLSLVVIFVPVSFMSSISGRFLFQFGITAGVAVMVSLLVSFTLTPMMSARLLKPASGPKDHDHASSRRGFYHFIDVAYTFLLKAAMRFRPAVALLAIAVSLSAIPLYQQVKREFVPSDVDEAEFQVNVNGNEGVSLAAMESVMQAVEKDLLETPGVQVVLATTGGGWMDRVNAGSAYVRIAPHDDRVLSFSKFWRNLLAGTPMKAFENNYSQRDVMQTLRKKFRRYEDVRISVRNFPSFNIGGGFFDLDLVFKGPDLHQLMHYAETIRDKTRSINGQPPEIPGILDADTSVKLNSPELHAIPLTERAGDLGVTNEQLGTALRILVGGEDRVSRFRDEQLAEDYDVRLRLEPEDRSTPEQIKTLYVPGRDGTLVDVRNIVEFQTTQAPARIDRIDRQRTVSLRGTVAPGFAQADRIEALRNAVAEMGLPAGYSITVQGRARELENTFTEFLYAFMFSVILMYIILAMNYESIIHPFTILLSLPLTVPFALLSLYLTNGTLNLYSALGLLVLFGVVKKNAILQIDHMNGLRAKGVPRYDAIIEANRDRLRPILMTTLALVAGMLPLYLGTGPGSEERRAVAVVVIGGQSLALLLTLLVTPVAYSYLDDLAALFTRKKSTTPTTPAQTLPETIAIGK